MWESILSISMLSTCGNLIWIWSLGRLFFFLQSFSSAHTSSIAIKIIGIFVLLFWNVFSSIRRENAIIRMLWQEIEHTFRIALNLAVFIFLEIVQIMLIFKAGSIIFRSTLNYSHFLTFWQKPHLEKFWGSLHQSYHPQTLNIWNF